MYIVNQISTLSLQRWYGPGVEKIGFNTGAIVVMILLPIVVAAFLIRYSKKVESRDWIN